MKRMYLLAYLLGAMYCAADEIPIECSVDYDVMYALAMNERHEEREVGYPYLISLNSRSQYANDRYAEYFIDQDRRTIDCKNRELCVGIMDDLISNGITNLDLGAMQINYFHHKLPAERYFVLGYSFNKACSLVEQHIEKRGFNWSAIACYHSKTPSINKVYAKKLQENYEKITNGRG